MSVVLFGSECCRSSRRLVSSAIVGIVLLGGAGQASATRVGYQHYCVPCGYRVLGPLSGRTLTPAHRIEIEVLCSQPELARFPELRLQDGTYWETRWVDEGAGISNESLVPSRRYSRVGPELPAGAVVELGTVGPRYCWEAASRQTPSSSPPEFYPCSTNDQGRLCCGSAAIAESGFVPVAVFQVEAAESASSQVDAGTSAVSSGFDASVVGRLDGGGHSVDASGDSAVDADAGGGRNQQRLAWRLGCTVNGESRAIFLDLAGEPVPDEIVRIEVLSRRVAINGVELLLGTRWDAPLCSGGEVRTFVGRDHPMRTGVFGAAGLADGRHTYRVAVSGEGAIVAETLDLDLDVPGDCVAPEALELDWQQLRFTVPCRDKSEWFDWRDYPEMSEEQAIPFACAPLSEPSDDAAGDWVFVDPAPAAPAPTSEISTAGTSVAPSDFGSSSPRRADVGACSVGIARRSGHRVSSYAAMVALAFGLARRRRK